MKVAIIVMISAYIVHSREEYDGPEETLVAKVILKEMDVLVGSMIYRSMKFSIPPIPTCWC